MLPGPSIRWSITDRSDSWDRHRLEHTDDPRFVEWTWLAQPHGSDVVTVTKVGEHRGAQADAAVTTINGATLVIRTADCAPILLTGSSEHGEVLGVAHAGWKGLAAGIVAATCASMRTLGAATVRAWLGPCIGPECYEFGDAALTEVSAAIGADLRGRTSWGTQSLDLAAGVAAACHAAGAEFAGMLPGWSCTACDVEQRFSHRARQDTGRLALIARLVGGQGSAVAPATVSAPM
jgi:polyphenol oxidase